MLKQKKQHGLLSSIEAKIISILPKKAIIFIFISLGPLYNLFKVAPHPNLMNRTLRLGSRSIFLLQYLIPLPFMPIQFCAIFQQNGGHIDYLFKNNGIKISYLDSSASIELILTE